MKTLEAKRRARADEYYKRKKYLLVRRGCGLVPIGSAQCFITCCMERKGCMHGQGPGDKAEVP